MGKKLLGATIICILLAQQNCAQFSDLAAINFTGLPQGNSEVGYTRLRGLFNYPIRLSKGKYLFVGLDYSKIELSFNENITTFDIDVLEDFQLLDLSIGYSFKLNEDWRFAARFSPGVSSNLVKQLNLEDVVFSGDVVFINDKRNDNTIARPFRLILGASYSGNRGFPFPLPFISYYRKFRPDWSFNLGVPKANLQYHFSKKNRLKWVAELDGFTSNIQDNIQISDGRTADKINMAVLISGLQYEYHYNQHLEFFMNTSFILSSNASLRNNRNRTVASLSDSNSAYFRTGVRFKL
ncbi:DUF6268 family outer membrane beta-barrel protein [Arenibacter sp. GZD96]|uniref:DUF6268 family outer membrane beta-barrel protein n=1 Tax=Aurantibrevibacter litoralis TaxID=3106030 RepID=UPI002AFFAE55|nr:DUF6268 family outer membrane beta-barrel protein [Arenibacter sp. GZD-96]MEA1786728.1 DUF6268 family outer membrane beta-barrel protein [Arenibacter sp. GZD-96]